MMIRPYGDRALLINFEQKIAPEIHTKVMALHRALAEAALPGITFYIPAYCSLTVGFDASRTRYKELQREITGLARNLSPDASQQPGRTLTIPVCYEAAFAPDIGAVSQQTGFSVAEIIALHTAAPFRVYMLGFLPGFAYLGILPEALSCSRRSQPRLKVPAGAVGLAGRQTGIYPSEAPGGWQLIGKTPVPMLNPEQEMPFLLQPGDSVTFYAIPEAAFYAIEREVAAGNFNPNTYYE